MILIRVKVGFKGNNFLREVCLNFHKPTFFLICDASEILSRYMMMEHSEGKIGSMSFFRILMQSEHKHPQLRFNLRFAPFFRVVTTKLPNTFTIFNNMVDMAIRMP